MMSNNSLPALIAMSQLKATLRKPLLDVACFGLTALFFAPCPFYFSGRIGIISWLNVSDDNPGDRFFPGRFGVSVVLWLISLVLVFKWSEHSESKSRVT